MTSTGLMYIDVVPDAGVWEKCNSYQNIEAKPQSVPPAVAMPLTNLKTRMELLKTLPSHSGPTTLQDHENMKLPNKPFDGDIYPSRNI